MNLKKLEQVMRGIAEKNSGRPALAGVTGIGDAQLPQEFRNAAMTLASRTHKSAQGRSILQIMTEAWM